LTGLSTRPAGIYPVPQLEEAGATLKVIVQMPEHIFLGALELAGDAGKTKILYRLDDA